MKPIENRKGEGAGRPRKRRRAGKRRLPRSLPLAESTALLGAAAKARDRLLISLGLFAGLRCSEMTRLEVLDLDLAAGQALLRASKGDKDRVVPLPAHLVKELLAWLAGRTTGLVFPSPRGGGRLTNRAVQRMVKRVAVAAGIPGAELPRRVHPHRLRHSAATEMLRAGVDIMTIKDILGHSSIATTQLYVSSDATHMRAASEKLAARFGMGKEAG